MFNKIIRITIWVIITLLVVLLLAYGASKSDFNNLKKYDEQDNSLSNIRAEMQNPSKEKKKLAKDRYYTTTVKVQSSTMANLGDFTMNISGDRKLIANISLKYKSNKDSSWLGNNSAKEEIMNKGDVLRSAVISAISGSDNVKISNTRMKKNLVKNINKYLSDGEVEEVYFNKFIIQ
ncbi:MAG: flagellar FliL protein [Sulfurimonas sp.]|jgi:flagellar FliL protein